MAYTFTPRGVCSRSILVELDGDKVKKVQFMGGCAGNTQGVARLVEGMDVQEAIKRLRGIKCGMRPSSCPDQLSIALEKALEESKK